MLPIHISPCVRPICREPVDSTHPDTQGSCSNFAPCCGRPAMCCICIRYDSVSHGRLAKLTSQCKTDAETRSLVYFSSFLVKIR